MPLRTRPTSSWPRRTARPTRAARTADDVELFEDDGAFVLTVEMPGFDPADVDVRWHDGLLNVSAEHVDEARDRERTVHRRFRFPKRVVDEEITADYDNGVLTVQLPIETATMDAGTEIEVEA